MSGIAGKLRSRVTQHLLRRDSSITTGASAVTLDPDQVTRVAWWVDPRFDDRATLQAAETVAFRLLDPVLRSRGRITEQANAVLDDDTFVSDMEQLFGGEPSGKVDLPSAGDLHREIQDLEARVADIESRLEADGE